MAHRVRSQMRSRNAAQLLARVSPVFFVATLAACSSLLGLEELHEGPAPGSSGSADHGGQNSAGSSGDSTNHGGSSPSAGSSGRGQGGSAAGDTSSAGAGDTTGDAGDTSTAGSAGTAGTAGKGGAGGNAGGAGTAGKAGAGGAAGSAGSAGTAGGPTTGTGVHGHVIDFWGHALSGVPVEIGGKVATTDKLGAFTIDNVAAEYDASLVVQFPDNYDGQIYGWVYQGLTRRDPTLQVLAGLTMQSGNVSITPSHAETTLTDGRTQSISFGGPDGVYAFTDVDAPGYAQTSVDWRGPPLTQETVHGLIFAEDPTSHLPTGYYAYDAKPISLNGEVTTISPVTLDMSAKTITSGNITGAVTPAAFDDRSNGVFLRFTSNAFIQLVDDVGPNTFTYNVPTIANGSVTIAAMEGYAPWGPYAMAHQGTLSAGATGVTLTIPKPSSNLAVAPATAVNKVDDNTTFSFQAGAGAAGLFVLAFENANTSALKTDGMYIVTSKKTLKLPKVVNDTFALIPANSYYWRVQTHGNLANADAAAGPEGFADSFGGDYYHDTPRGPRRGSGSFTISGYSDKITMAPLARNSKEERARPPRPSGLGQSACGGGAARWPFAAAR